MESLDRPGLTHSPIGTNRRGLNPKSDPGAIYTRSVPPACSARNEA